MKLRFKKLDERAVLPCYKHEGDSGMDIRANDVVEIPQGSVAKISTGIAAEIPEGYELQVRPRSGLSSKGIVAILGTVDSNYRGDIGVILMNCSYGTYTVDVGDRIAQLVLCKVAHADIEECPQGEQLSETVRGADGFGSTGVK